MSEKVKVLSSVLYKDGKFKNSHKLPKWLNDYEVQYFENGVVLSKDGYTIEVPDNHYIVRTPDNIMVMSLMEYLNDTVSAKEEKEDKKESSDFVEVSTGVDTAPIDKTKFTDNTPAPEGMESLANVSAQIKINAPKKIVDNIIKSTDSLVKGSEKLVDDDKKEEEPKENKEPEISLQNQDSSYSTIKNGSIDVHPVKVCDIDVFLVEGAKLPTYETEGSVGYDFSAFRFLEAKNRAGYVREIPDTEVFRLEPGSIIKICTGVKMKFPPNLYMELVLRSSSHYDKDLLMCSEKSIIDSDHVGFIHIVLRNMCQKTITLEKGMRLAQGIIKERIRAKFNISDTEFNPETRDPNGFGTTGNF